MNHMQATKIVNAVRPGAIIDDAAITGQVIDTLGFNYCTIVFQMGATDIAMSALKLTECASSGGSYDDVSGAVFGTSENIAGTTSALPTATDDNNLFILEIDCRKRQRYLKPAGTFGNGTSGGFLAATAFLSQGSISPVTAAERGVSQIVRV